MGFSFSISPLLLALLLSTVNCNHEDHHSHHSDDRWPSILSKIEFLWKSTTAALSTTTEVNESYDTKGHHGTSQNAVGEHTTEISPTPTAVMQNGTLMEDVKEGFHASLALMVGAPIVGIILLCCCCYCCCKCCLVCCQDEDEGKVVVLQQNNCQPPSNPTSHHTQVILQQPVYQTPPIYGPPPQQWGPAPQQQWAPHQHPAAYDNPDYGSPTAPPQYGQKY